jgi:hypothetical protein
MKYIIQEPDLILSTYYNLVTETPGVVFTTMRGNQLPVSDSRWQHGSRQCFATSEIETIEKLHNC